MYVLYVYIVTATVAFRVDAIFPVKTTSTRRARIPTQILPCSGVTTSVIFPSFRKPPFGTTVITVRRTVDTIDVRSAARENYAIPVFVYCVIIIIIIFSQDQNIIILWQKKKKKRTTIILLRRYDVVIVSRA